MSLPRGACYGFAMERGIEPPSCG